MNIDYQDLLDLKPIIILLLVVPNLLLPVGLLKQAYIILETLSYLLTIQPETLIQRRNIIAHQ